MENIYDTRLKEELLFILPLDVCKNPSIKIEPGKIAVAVNLFYLDTIEKYMGYINQIPEEIDVYVFSSKSSVLEKVEGLKGRDVILLEKENRGRDVSALLVAFRKIALKYEYICFLHDKKPNYEYKAKDVEIWDKSLWGNMIGSAQYIYSVLELLQKNLEIGLLLPPEMLGEYHVTWFFDGWAENYENTVTLAKELRLNCDISREKSALAFGTAFWAKTACLRKLFQKEWKYDDFVEEPMPLQGTISHAIERIFGFVAQDAGYKTATIMTAEYAAWNLLFAQDGMKKMYKLMSEQMNLHSLHQISMLSEQERVLREFCEKNEDVYLYGAGVYGVELLGHMAKWGLKPTGFVVSDGKRIKLEVEGYPVKELSEIEKNDKTGIIIAVHYMHQEEMQKILENKGFTNFVNGYM